VSILKLRHLTPLPHPNIESNNMNPIDSKGAVSPSAPVSHSLTASLTLSVVFSAYKGTTISVESCKAFGCVGGSSQLDTGARFENLVPDPCTVAAEGVVGLTGLRVVR
jgi:hypothetical protein